MIVCVGEAYYNDDSDQYQHGSIRTFVTYSVANKDHECYNPAFQRNNPLWKQVDNMKYNHNIEKNNLVLITNKKILN